MITLPQKIYYFYLYMETGYKILTTKSLNPLSPNRTKGLNSLKKICRQQPTNCLSLFDQFVWLELNGLKPERATQKCVTEELF